MSPLAEDDFLEKLAPELRRQRTPRAGSCPDSGLLAAYSEGQVPPSLKETLAAHLKQCPQCAEIFAHLVNFDKPNAAETSPEWVNAEKRLDIWMDGFLRERANKATPKPSERATSVSPRNSFLKIALSWKLGLALALGAVIAAIPSYLLTTHRAAQGSRVEIAVNNQPPRQTPSPEPTGTSAPGPESPKVSRTPAIPTPPNRTAPHEPAPAEHADSDSSNVSPPDRSSIQTHPTNEDRTNEDRTKSNEAPQEQPPAQMGQRSTVHSFVPAPIGGYRPGSAQKGLPAPSAMPAAPGEARSLGRMPSQRGGPNLALARNQEVHFTPNGQIRSVDRNGMHIEHNLHGGRTVVSERNGARIVTTGRDGGYVQRPYVTRNGRSYYTRTYYEHGVYRSVVYRGYVFGGHTYYSYVPAVYYGPAFYLWTSNPWPGPVYWSVGDWGWGGPWYAYYGYQPYPYYVGSVQWLTDYEVSTDLQQAYNDAPSQDNSQDQTAQDQPVPSQPTPNQTTANVNINISLAVKEQIAEEVKQEIKEEQTAADRNQQAQQSGPNTSNPGAPDTVNEAPPALTHKIFIVSSDLAVSADGQECSLTEGDVLRRIDDTPDGDQRVGVAVLSSKKGDCASGKVVAVSVDDLQEMYNHSRERLDDGERVLAARQGQGKIPAAPQASATASSIPPPKPDQSAASALQQQRAEADQIELQVQQETGRTGAGPQ
jgi:hypothetical protein